MRTFKATRDRNSTMDAKRMKHKKHSSPMERMPNLNLSIESAYQEDQDRIMSLADEDTLDGDLYSGTKRSNQILL